MARLRAIMDRVGSANAAVLALHVSPDVLADALTGKRFKRSTVERVEAKIDALLAEGEREKGRGAA